MRVDPLCLPPGAAFAPAPIPAAAFAPASIASVWVGCLPAVRRRKEDTSLEHIDPSCSLIEEDGARRECVAVAPGDERDLGACGHGRGAAARAARQGADQDIGADLGFGALRWGRGVLDAVEALVVVKRFTVFHVLLTEVRAASWGGLAASALDGTAGFDGHGVTTASWEGERDHRERGSAARESGESGPQAW